MRNKLLRLSALSAALAPGFALAIGLGDIILHSRMGEPLRAEIPLLGSGEGLDSTCFSLTPLPGADLPVVTSARTQLVRQGASARLVIMGSKPISEPLFMVSIKAGCGIDLERDYILMPHAPVTLIDAIQPAIVPAEASRPQGKGKVREQLARSGDTLESIAEAHYPDSLIKQRRQLAALKRANPELAPDVPLPEGTPVNIPDMRRMPAEREVAPPPPPPTSPPPVQVQPARSPKAEKPATAPVKKPSPPPVAKGSDRLVLGGAEEVRPGSKSAARQASLSEMENRMAKLETALSLLNQELDKMNNAVLLAAQTLEAQQKLQQASPPPPPPPVTAPTPPAAVQTTAVPAIAPADNKWQDLLLSALLGSAIAIGLAQLLSRRRPPVTESELPLSLAATRSRPSQAVHSRAPADGLSAYSVQPQVTEFAMTDDQSVLELAEIMLAFGKVQSAAETLASHIEATSPDNIQPWSMLLDLYRRGGMRTEYETLAARMRQRFNTHIAAWTETDLPHSGLKSLEDYAHILAHTTATWGSQACLDYLHHLTLDTRAGQRDGFPLEVLEEIALLMHILERAYGLIRPA